MLFRNHLNYVKKGVIVGAISFSLLSSPLLSFSFSSPVLASESDEAENPLSLIDKNRFSGKIDTTEELQYLYDRIAYIKSNNYYLSKLEQNGVIVNADLDYKNTSILVNQNSAFPFSLLEDSLEIEQNKVEYFYLADYNLHFPNETKDNDNFLAELSSDGIIFPKKLGQFQVVIRYNHHYFVRTVIVKKPNVVLPAARVKEVEKIEKEIVAKLNGLKPIEQVLRVHDYLVDTIRYGVLEEGSKRHNAQGKYGALVDKVAICEGYALGFSSIMKRLGINSRTVRGYIAGQKHAWNMVELDGEWYHIDVTADDIEFNSSNGTLSPIMKYRYFLLDENTLKNTHKDFTYHDGTGTKYRDYPLKEIKIDSLDEFNSVLEKQFEKFTTKQGYIDVFAKNTLSREALKKAVEDYFKDKNVNVSVDSNGFTNFSFPSGKPDYILQSIKITLNGEVNNQSVSFQELVFNNEAENKLVLTLSEDIEGLSLNHLVISGATKQSLEKVNGEKGKYLLTVDSYVKGSDLKVEIKKRGYNIQPSSKVISLPAENTGEPEPTPPPSEKPHDGKTNENEAPAPNGNKPPSGGDTSSSGSGGTSSGGSAPSSDGGTSSSGGPAPSGDGGTSSGGSAPSGDGGTSSGGSAPSDKHLENKTETVLSAKKTDESIKNLLKKTKKTSSSKRHTEKIEWKIGEKETSNLVSITLGETSFQRLEKSNIRGLNIKTENFGLYLPQNQLKYLQQYSNGTIELKMSKEDEGENPIYHFSFINSEGKELKKTGKHKVAISLPYSLKRKETPEHIIAYTVDKKGTRKIIPSSYYDKKTKELRVITDSSSTIMIGFKKQKMEHFLKSHTSKKDIDFVRTRNLLKFNSGKLNPNSLVTFGELIEVLAKFEGKNLDKNSYIKWAKDNNLIQKNEKQTLKNPINNKTFTTIMNRYSKSIGFTKKFKSQSTKNLSRSKVATLLRNYIEAMNQ